MSKNFGAGDGPVVLENFDHAGLLDDENAVGAVAGMLQVHWACKSQVRKGIFQLKLGLAGVGGKN
jgi:hypothetical protein